MKSPFPGMNPYLEKYWHEVHQRLVIFTGDSLRSLLPHTLKARIGERTVRSLWAMRLEQEPGDYRSMGDYDDFDYRADPDPPLKADDAKLADEWLRSKGLR